MTEVVKEYIIIAGINGGGKSSIYDVDMDLFKSSVRVNADEILKFFNGDWRSDVDSLKAIRQAIKLLNLYIKMGVSFHQETTLAASLKAYIRRISNAKKQGYYVKLIYVYLDSVELAIERVVERVRKGGHGVSAKRIRKRYSKSLTNLNQISSYCDEIFLFDNSKKMELVYYRKKNKIIVNELNNYKSKYLIQFNITEKRMNCF